VDKDTEVFHTLDNHGVIYLSYLLKVICNDLNLSHHWLLTEGSTGDLHDVGDSTLVGHARVVKSLQPEWLTVEVRIGGGGSTTKGNFDRLRIVGKRSIAVQALSHGYYYNISQSHN
jgi:hypothetical protein